MAQQNHKPGVRADGQKRVYWKDQDVDTVCLRAAELIFIDSKMGMGPALIQAQKDVFTKEKHRSEDSLRNVGSKLYGNKIKDFINKLSQDLKKREAKVESEKRPAQGKPQVTPEQAFVTPTPQPEPVPGQFFPAINMDNWLESLTDNIAAKFKVTLKTKLQKAYRDAHMEAAAEGLPPLYQVQKPEADSTNKLATGVQTFNLGSDKPAVQTFSRVKVALVGDETDDRFYEKVRRGLEDYYEFIKVRRPGDMQGHHDVKVVVCSSADRPGIVGQALITAKAVAPHAELYLGHGSVLTNTWLENKYDQFREEFIKQATAS